MAARPAAGSLLSNNRNAYCCVEFLEGVSLEVTMALRGSGKDKKKKQGKAAAKKDSSLHKKQGKPQSTGKLAAWFEKAGPFIMLTVVSVLLFVAPFQRGLFFPRELLIAKAFIFGLLVVWGLFRLVTRDGRLIESPLDICLIVLLLAYLVSFFVAVHKRDALEELLKIASYLVVYLAAIEICRFWRWPLQKVTADRDLQNNPALKERSDHSSSIPPGLNIVLQICLAAAFIVTIASLGAAAGYWEFAGAYRSARIASPMGYANAAAAYLMASYLLAIALAPLAHKWFKLLYLVPAVLMLITVILTFSRGAWLLLPPLALLLIVAASPGQRVRSFLYLVATAVAAVPAAFMADPFFQAGEPGRAWLIFFTAVVVTVVLGIGAELYLSKSRRVRLALAGAAAVAAAVAVTVFIVLPATGPVLLERGAEEQEELQKVEQIIGDIKPGEEYRLSLEVKAVKETLPDSSSPGYVWGLKVFEGIEGYDNLELLDYSGTETEGWEAKELSFRTSKEALRLEVHIYNRYPGTSVSARQVMLSSAAKDHHLNFTLSRVLPERLYERLFSFSLDRNLDRRLDFYVDAVKIIRDYPVLGAGGGGWNALYRSYQDIHYNSTEVHNHFLQVWIEAGLFGFLAFTGIWISFAAAFIRNCVKKKVPSREWQYWTASFIPVVALGAHSVIDWNFSMAAVGIFLFVLLGAGRSLDRNSWFGRPENKEIRPGRRGLYIGIAGTAAGVVLLAYTLTLFHGLNATWRSQEYIEQGNYKQAVTEIQIALRSDPYRSDNYHNLNVLIEDRVRRTQSAAEIEEMLELAERAYELEPFNPSYVSRLGNLLLHYVDVDQGLAYLDSLMELRPFIADSYREPAFTRLQLAEFLIEQNRRPEAEVYLNEILEFEALIKEFYGEAKPLFFALARAHFLLGNNNDALFYYEQVDEEDVYYDTAQSDLEEIRNE